MSKSIYTRPFYRTLENWNTRYGTSTRLVTRDKLGKIVDNVSLTGLLSSNRKV